MKHTTNPKARKINMRIGYLIRLHKIIFRDYVKPVISIKDIMIKIYIIIIMRELFIRCGKP